MSCGLPLSRPADSSSLRTSISPTRGSTYQEHITGYSWSGCRSPVGAHSSSASRRCSEPRPLRPGRVHRLGDTEEGPRQASRVTDARRRRTSRSTLCLFGEDRAVQVALPWPHGRLSTTIREPKDRQVRLRPGVRERVGARYLREAADQMRSLSTSPVPSGHRRRHSLAFVRTRRHRTVIRCWRLSTVARREVLLSRHRLRQDGMAGRCRCRPPSL